MRCDFCGKKVDEGSKYCTYCGAKIKTEPHCDPEKEYAERDEASKVYGSPKGGVYGNSETVDFSKDDISPKGETGKKKGMSPGIIILIVFLVSALIVSFVIVTGVVAFRVMDKKGNIDEIIGDINSWEDNFDDYFDGDSDIETPDDVDDFFDRYFGDGDSIDDVTGDPDFYPFIPDFDSDGSYRGTDSFEPGTTDTEYGRYVSEFGELKFQMPARWNVYDDTKLNGVYSAYGVPAAARENGLCVFDFYAGDTLTGDKVYIKYSNKDYTGLSTIDSYNDAVKKEARTSLSDYKVDYAKDSTIMLNGNEYAQLACRITGDEVTGYQFNFTRDLGDYYMDIYVFSFDIDDVGEIIGILNAEG